VNVCVHGEGHLAEATRTVCELRHIEQVSPTDAEIFWVCIDMPVSQRDESHVGRFFDELDEALLPVRHEALVLISTQVPVGTTALLEKKYPERRFATQPENIRKAHAVADLQAQNRIVIGSRRDDNRVLLTELFKNFTPGAIHFFSPESAEMVKHALNAFLAMEIVFANEIADICREVGADPDDVSQGLRSDHRVGSGPLKPGGPYTGGTLGRDVVTLNTHGAGPLLRAIKESNDARL
jgi:UDPglucose 6-dehydrogenase